jgi:hypothetical protein
MRRFLIVLGLVLAMLPMLSVGTARLDEAEAASAYCTPWANTPTDIGAWVEAKGGYSCSSHAVPARWQICLYQGSTLMDCNAGSRFANSATFTTTCSSISTADAGFQTWMWVEDDTGGSTGRWSATGYRDKCR